MKPLCAAPASIIIARDSDRFDKFYISKEEAVQDMNVYQNAVDAAHEALAKKLSGTLLSHGYKTAEYAATAADAAALALKLIPGDATVGIPGTVTVRELGLPEALAAKGCKIFQHWDPSLKPEDRSKRLLEENLSDWFVTSSNAMTQDGHMVNIDGTGNRVACMAWGPGKMLFILSLDKVTRNLESAIARARDFGTPPNALRIGSTPPCTAVGHCVDCNAPNRVCRVVTILERVPFGREAHVILVGEKLGY